MAIHGGTAGYGNLRPWISASVLMLSCQVFLSAQPTGAISGSVRVSQGNRAMANVTVYAHNELPSVPNRSTRTVAAADGSFAFRNLPPGRYILCAHNPAGDLVDSCLWNLKPTIIAVVAGQETRNSVVSLVDGVRVSVRLVDTGNTLAKEPQEYVSPFVNLGIVDTATGLRFVPNLKRQNAGTLEYELLVPRERSYRLDIGSTDVVLQPTGGPAVARNGSSQLFTVTATSQHNFVYTVVSRR